MKIAQHTKSELQRMINKLESMQGTRLASREDKRYIKAYREALLNMKDSS